MQLGAAKKVMQRGGANSLDYVERAIELAQFGLAEARRSAFSFQPSVIDELGLVRAMQKLVDRSNIPGKLLCNFASTGVWENSLPPSAQEDLLRIPRKRSATRFVMPSRQSCKSICTPIHQTSLWRSPTMDPASLIQTMPAEMVSDYLTCRQEQKILVRSLRFERRSGKALASPFVSRFVDSEARTEKRPAVNPLASRARRTLRFERATSI